jgi:hypothetical protein
MNTPLWPNAIVAVSNVLGIPTLLTSPSKSHQLVTTLVMLASTLMHLSETKHNLIGFRPLNRWSAFFLNLDRVAAIFALLYLVFNVSFGDWLPVLSVGVFGVVMSALSEWVEGGYIWFTITHCLWHCSVYYILYVLGNQ